MDYEKLLEPYKEGGRTLTGQITWLVKKGIPKAIIDQAMLYVYDELDRGAKFDNGHDLDRALYTKATELMKSEAEDSLKKLQDFHQKLREKWGDDLSKMKKTPLWLKILTLGIKE